MRSKNNSTTEQQSRVSTILTTDNNGSLNAVKAPAATTNTKITTPTPILTTDTNCSQNAAVAPVLPGLAAHDISVALVPPGSTPSAPLLLATAPLVPGPLAPVPPAPAVAIAETAILSPTTTDAEKKTAFTAPPVSPAPAPALSPTTKETTVAMDVIPPIVQVTPMQVDAQAPAPVAPVPPAAAATATTLPTTITATNETVDERAPASLAPFASGSAAATSSPSPTTTATNETADVRASALLEPVPPAPAAVVTKEMAIATLPPATITAKKGTAVAVNVAVAPISPTHALATDQAKSIIIQRKPTAAVIVPPPPSLTFRRMITAPPPTTHNPIAYYAVRKGKFGLRSCIFLTWKDCEEYLNEHTQRNNNNIDFHCERVEFASFPTVEDALQYLNTSTDVEMSDGGYLQHSSSWQQEQQINLDSCTTTPLNTMLSSASSPQNLISGTLRPGRSGGQKALANPNRRPTKAWEKMFDDLKAYKDAHGLLYISDKKEHVELSRWIRGQHNEYKYWKEGQPSSMFPMKIQKLLSIGFEFNYVSVEERFKCLLSYRRIHGNYNVPINHPILGKWVDRQKKAAKKFSTGDPSYYFENTIKDLKSLGLDLDLAHNPSASSTLPEINRNAIATTTATVVAASGGLVRLQETTQDEEERKWSCSFEQLRAYKIRHHTCEVPPSQHTPLSYWVTKQHQEYQKVKEGNASKLTVNRLQRLNDLGFVFRKMGKTHTWEERMGQLKRYKEEFGHSKVPKSHPELGVFVNRQRYEYTKWIQGRASTMNEKRKKDLENLNFVFVAGKKMSHVDFKNKKTWDERYLELLQFRDVYGHAIVPQSYPGLGEWVHTQRTYYKKLKRGKQSPLTAERVLKLADIGFAFDATKRRGNHITDDEHPKV